MQKNVCFSKLIKNESKSNGITYLFIYGIYLNILFSIIIKNLGTFIWESISGCLILIAYSLLFFLDIQWYTCPILPDEISSLII